MSETLAKASQEAAKNLGISRTSFIRRAIWNELERFQREFEQEIMANTLKAMEANSSYMAESKEIDEGFKTSLSSHEQEEWWKKSL